MITYATDQTAPQVRQMWKTVFGDSDAYMDIYFRCKYRNSRTLIYLENDRVVASLQILPYQFTFCGVEIPVAYISGVCTLPDVRKKGYMHQLLLKSFEEMGKSDVPLAILVPQEEWLLKFYNKYGYAQTFEAGMEELPSLKTFLEKSNGDKTAAYQDFDKLFRTHDVTVQKTFIDFEAMVEEAQLFHFPPKKNLIGMARVIDAKRLLTIFAEKYSHSCFIVKVADEYISHNRMSFSIDCGVVREEPRSIAADFEVDIKELARLLLGYHTSEEESLYLADLFPEKRAQMNYMLE